MNTTSKLSALALAFAGLLAGSAQATVLFPGTVANSFHSPGPFALGGTVLARNTQEVDAPNFSGTLRTAVVRENEHHLNFYYQFERSGGGTAGDEDIGKLSVSNFGNDDLAEIFQSAAAFDIFTAGNQQATKAERGTDGTIGILFGSGGTIGGSETSWTQVIRTHAAGYQTGQVGIDGWTQTLVAYQPGQSTPAQPVPEPETYAMMLAGLGLLGILRRRHPAKAG